MRFLSYLNARNVITAGIIGLYFQNEIRKVYRDLSPTEEVAGVNEDIIYLEKQSCFNLKYIYDWFLPEDPAKGLFSSLDDPLKVLDLVESPDPDVRRHALQYMIENRKWRDYHYQQIAQFCSFRTTASLARVKDVDVRFFRAMPKIVDVELENPLQSEEPQTDEPLDEESDKQISEEDLHMESLADLTVKTLLPQRCKEFVNGGGLPYLQQMLMKYSSNMTVVRLIAYILANLTVTAEVHPRIIEGGWALVLHQWLVSDDIQLYLHASRALANLDRDWETDIRVPAVYEDGIYLGHPVYRSRLKASAEENEMVRANISRIMESDTDEGVTADIVFIHGLQGGPFKTWRQKDKTNHEDSTDDVKRTVFWPKDWLVPDLSENVRILNIGYDASLSVLNAGTQNTKSRTMIQTGSALLDKLKQADVGSRPVIWVGHSMGGLLIKEILFIAETDPRFKQFSKNTAGVIFYSTPHKGSGIANLASLLYTTMKDLQYGNEYLIMLHKSFKFTVLKYDIPCLSFGEGEKTEIGLRVFWKIVKSESADPDVGEFYEVPYNHINTCKPESKNSQLYKFTLSFIHRCIQNVQKHTTEGE